MSFDLEFSEQAQADIEKHKKSGNKAVLNKIFSLVDELYENPFIGSGKPEPLKYELSGYWSRRINKEHRLVYKVSENKIYIHSVFGHYL